MKILSIDVGIKNLAFCLFDTQDHCRIVKWDTVNIADQQCFTCDFVEKNNNACNKPAKFTKEHACYCAKHAKKQTYKIPPPDLKHSLLKKSTLQKLQDIAIKYNIQYEPKAKKAQLLDCISQHVDVHYFEPIETKKANEVNLFDIGVNIKDKFNLLFKDEHCIEYVIIENQIGPLAIRMKTVQGMLVQYFIMSTLNVQHIEFISSANKLKDCLPQDTEKYSDRKKLGIVKCLEMLHDSPDFAKHIAYFNSHKKKDDLADSFLQGMWFIRHTKL